MAIDLFSFAINVKSQKLGIGERMACQRFVESKLREPDSPYLQLLYRVFKAQLKHKMGFIAKQCTFDFMDAKIKRQMRIFLKDKFNLRKPIEPEFELADRAQWDPHNHDRALFAEKFQKAILFLPNFQEAYDYMKPLVHDLKDQEKEEIIQSVMKSRLCPRFSEVGTHKPWPYQYHGKSFITIYGHKREQGAVPIQDVPSFDVCGQENEVEYISLKEFLSSLKRNQVIRVHMGETVLPKAGKDNLNKFIDELQMYHRSEKPVRIGHGTHMGISDMKRVAKEGYYVEACLSSNKRNAVINKRSEYPLGIMLLFGVKVVIGTDGGQLYRTSLAEEYAHAKKNLEKFHLKLRESDDMVLMNNGDSLGMTYRQLGGTLDKAVLDRISVETLVNNAQELLKACY